MQYNNNTNDNDNRKRAASSPLPEGLRRLPERFSRADKNGIAPDLAESVRVLVQSAWDGSIFTGVSGAAGVPIPLAEAIKSSTSELDAAAMSYLATVVADIEAVIGVGNFKSEIFSNDVVTAFDNLKKMDFGGMGVMHYDNIQGALSKDEESWRDGPHKMEVFAIQQFTLRIVDFAESLHQRTGFKLDDEAPVSATALVPAPVLVPAPAPVRPSSSAMNYESSELIVKGLRWPGCVNNRNPDWAQLFRAKNEDGYDSGPWLTPRMAMKIHHAAISAAHDLLEDFDSGSLSHPRLPKIARPFFKTSEKWRLAFRDCYARIGLRLQKGLDPSPNCTGEEMAFHNIMHLAPDAEDVYVGEPEYDALPKYPNDDNYNDVTDNAIDDLDVLNLFGPNDKGYDSPSDRADAPYVDDPMMRTANLHPKDWFLAFRDDKFRDHEQ